VLHDASVVISAGDRSAVVGPNGVGKSTLLRVLAGVVPPDAGTVTAAGTVGYLPQERDRRPDETALDYIARRTGVAAAEAAMLAASDRLARSAAQGGSPAAVDDPGAGAASREYAAALDTYLALGGPDLHVRATELAASLGLPADLNRAVAAYSGGQAARLALAAVLLARFDVLLLDEPTNDLDVDTLRALEEALLDFPGCAVIISHDRWFLDRIATHILAFEGNSEVVWFEGNYADYESDRRRRLGAEAHQPHRIRYKPLVRS